MSLNVCGHSPDAYVSPRAIEYAVICEGVLCTSGMIEELYDDGEQDW